MPSIEWRPLNLITGPRIVRVRRACQEVYPEPGKTTERLERTYAEPATSLCRSMYVLAGSDTLFLNKSLFILGFHSVRYREDLGRHW